MKNKLLMTVLILSGIFLGNLSWAVTCPEGSWDNSSGVCIPTSTGLPSPSGSDPVASVIENVMMWLLGAVGIIAIVAFIISGLQYLLSAGDQNMIETAKRNMKWSIVGIVVALMGLVMLNFIFDIMGGSSGGFSSSTSSESLELESDSTSDSTTTTTTTTEAESDTSLPISK